MPTTPSRSWRENPQRYRMEAGKCTGCGEIYFPPRRVCAECGAVSSKWSGRCDGCGAWNTISEDIPLSSGPAAKGLGGTRGKVLPLGDLATADAPPPRTASGIGELDRVLGGGLVPASAVLVGGDPGIGKSTLLLQVAAALAVALLTAACGGAEDGSAGVIELGDGFIDVRLKLGMMLAPMKGRIKESIEENIRTSLV